MKPHKCKVCQTEYTKTRPLQKVCSPMCALELSRTIQKKIIVREQAKDRQETRQRLDAMQTKPQLTKKAQTAFNAFVRARDAGKPCISCGTTLSNEPNTYDAGHYRSVGSAVHMRFVEDNCHGQCKHCNNYLAGNHVEYRKRLIERIGLQSVESIESDNTLRKYSHEGLIELAKHYRAAALAIKKAST
jgi:hypothetical protein